MSNSFPLLGGRSLTHFNLILTRLIFSLSKLLTTLYFIIFRQSSKLNFCLFWILSFDAAIGNEESLRIFILKRFYFIKYYSTYDVIFKKNIFSSELSPSVHHTFLDQCQVNKLKSNSLFLHFSFSKVLIFYNLE